MSVRTQGKLNRYDQTWDLNKSSLQDTADFHFKKYLPMDTSGWYVFLTKKACNEVCFFLCVHEDQGPFITYVEQKFKATAVWNMMHFNYINTGTFFE